MSWTHEHKQTLSGTPERVFAALTNAGELKRWFAEHAEIRIEPGGPFRFWGKHTLGNPQASDARQQVVAAVPGCQLRFTWPMKACSTEVAIDLSAEGEGAILTLKHTVDGNLGVPRERELIDDHWRMAMGNLGAHIEGGAGICLPDYADPNPEVRMTIIIEAPREAVFRALLEPEAINQWAGSTAAAVEPRKGGRYSYGWEYEVGGRKVKGGPTKILEFVENERLVIDWPDWRGDETVTGQTISFQLESVPEGTRVTLVHAGFSRTADISDYPFGWGYFLSKIGELVTQTAAKKANP
jgi:uncharacterized protein YndB with AHSA1/START domain